MRTSAPAKSIILLLKRRLPASQGTLNTRWSFRFGQAVLPCALAVALTAAPPRTAAQTQRLWIGTHLPAEGIYTCTLDVETGALGPATVAADAPRPGFLALHPTLPVLYAISVEPRQPDGGIRAFRFTTSADSLVPLSQQSTEDRGATHLAVDADGKMLLVAHYSGGSTALLPLSSDGVVQPVAALVEHQGSSVDPNRQTAPFAHGVAIDGSGRYVCVADLGTDEVIVYRIDDAAKLTRVAAWKAAPGSGPRHLAFHPSGKWLYCINELKSTMSVLAFDAADGGLREVQTISTLPADFRGANTTAEVVVHPSGKFVYGSNRGHDSTAVFAVDEGQGTLSLIEVEPTGGGHPRFIGLDPTGRILIAANRDANNLVSFHVDVDTGAIEPTGFHTMVPQPVCAVFQPTDE